MKSIYPINKALYVALFSLLGLIPGQSAATGLSDAVELTESLPERIISRIVSEKATEVARETAMGIAEKGIDASRLAAESAAKTVAREVVADEAVADEALEILKRRTSEKASEAFAKVANYATDSRPWKFGAEVASKIADHGGRSVWNNAVVPAANGTVNAANGTINKVLVPAANKVLFPSAQLVWNHPKIALATLVAPCIAMQMWKAGKHVWTNPKGIVSKEACKSAGWASLAACKKVAWAPWNVVRHPINTAGATKNVGVATVKGVLSPYANSIKYICKKACSAPGIRNVMRKYQAKAIAKQVALLENIAKTVQQELSYALKHADQAERKSAVQQLIAQVQDEQLKTSLQRFVVNFDGIMNKDKVVDHNINKQERIWQLNLLRNTLNDDAKVINTRIVALELSAKQENSSK